MSNSDTKNHISKRFIESTLWNQVGKNVQFLLNFMLTVVISRKLGRTLYGEYTWFISFCMFFGLLTQLGFENILNIYIPKLKDSQARISYLLGRLVSVRIFVTFMVCVLLFVFLPWLQTLVKLNNFYRIIYYAFGYIFFSNLSSLFSRVLVSCHRLKYLSLVNITVSALQLITIYILLSKGYGIKTIFLIITVAAIILCISYLSTLRRLFFLSSQPFDLKPLTSLGITSWFTTLVEFGLGKQIDIILVGIFISNIAEAGLYNIGITTPTMFSALMTAGLGGVVLTVFSEIETKKNSDKLGEAWQSMIKLQFLLSAPLIAFVVMFARPIIVILYTESYLPAVILTQVCGFFLLAQRILGGGTHITVLYSKESAKTVLITRLSGGLLNLVLDLFLIPSYGALGAIVATGACLLLTVALEYMFVRKILHHKYPLIFILKVSFAIAISISIINNFYVENFISLFCVGSGYMVLLITILFLIKPFSYLDRTNNFLSSIAYTKYFRYFCSLS